nr:C-type mannose receptor 2-like [Misgurnus anguillicaudatus]
MSGIVKDSIDTSSTMDREEKEEKTIDIYITAETVRDLKHKKEMEGSNTTTTTQPPKHTENESLRMRRSAIVCLVLLFVLLLTAVIVLCVLIITNNQQFHIKNKHITEERDEFIAKYNNITKLYEQLNWDRDELQTHIHDGWIYCQLSLYFISFEMNSWDESRRDCRERGADLIIINSNEEQDFVSKFSGTFWIGLSDSDVEDRWKWVDNSTLNSSFSFWEASHKEPNALKMVTEDGVKSTAHIYENTRSKLGDSNTTPSPQPTVSLVKMRCYRSATVCLVLLCVLLLTAVIELSVKLIQDKDQLRVKIDNLTKVTDFLFAKSENLTNERNWLMWENNILQKNLNKGDGWIYLSLYFISTEMKTWNESRIYCRERGGDLIIINNKEEEDFISRKTISSGARFWIGLSDSDVEGTWRWVDGTPLNSSFWAAGEPNGNISENCVESIRPGWNDASCYIAQNWICERNVLK